MVKWAKGCKALWVPEVPVNGRCFYYLRSNRRGGRKGVTPQASPHCVYSGPLLLSLSPNLSLRWAVSPTAPMLLFRTLRNDRILIEK